MQGLSRDIISPFPKFFTHRATVYATEKPENATYYIDQGMEVPDQTSLLMSNCGAQLSSYRGTVQQPFTESVGRNLVVSRSRRRREPKLGDLGVSRTDNKGETKKKKEKKEESCPSFTHLPHFLPPI